MNIEAYVSLIRYNKNNISNKHKKLSHHKCNIINKNIITIYLLVVKVLDIPIMN